MKPKTAFTILLFHLLTGCAIVSWHPYFKNYEVSMDQGDKRFLVSAKINGKPASLTLDTGADCELALFSPAAKRLGLKFYFPPSDLGSTNGVTLVSTTPPYLVNVFNSNCKVPINILNYPIAADIDGFVGWQLIANDMTQFDVAGRSVRFLDKIPAEARQWTMLRLRRKHGTLALEIPTAQGDGIILIDTGSDGGVSLNSERWREWTAAHPDRPKTINFYYMGGAGVVIGEESWAEQLSLGPLTLTNVPVHEANVTERTEGADYQATLGLAALERLDLIVDGAAGVAYVRPRQGPFRPFPYNRAGVVFAPRDLRNGEGSELIAHVLEGGPAYEAGIRDGDVPLKMGDQWRTNWTEGPSILACKLPAGTKFDLTLQRGERTFTAEVVLRDLLPPSASGLKQ